jgi:hypothetical protein
MRRLAQPSEASRAVRVGSPPPTRTTSFVSGSSAARVVRRWSAPIADSAATAVAIFVVEAGVRAASEAVPYRCLPVVTSRTAAVGRGPSAGSFSRGMRVFARALPSGADFTVLMPPRPVSTGPALGAGRGCAGAPGTRP